MNEEEYNHTSYQTNNYFNNQVEENPEIKEKIKNQFEFSVASLGDIYRLQAKNDISNHNDNVLSYEDMKEAVLRNRVREKSSRGRKKTSGNESNSLKINNVNIFLDPETSKNSLYAQPKNENQSLNECITVNYLKPSKLPESKKYQHVKSGKINPPKSSYSLRSQTDKKIQNHEETMSKVVLYSSPVKIQNNYCTHTKNFNTPYVHYNNYDIFSPNSTNEGGYSDTPMVVVGGGQEHNYANNTNYNMVNKTQNFNNTNMTNTINNNALVTYPQEKQMESSRVERNIQKQYESLYAYTKDFFISNANKVPSKGGIEDIIKQAKEMEHSLEKYKKKVGEEKIFFKNSNKNLNNSPSKTQFHNKSQSQNTTRKIIKPRSPKKYLQIDPEERKKIEEKLEMLHLEIRTTFDNLKNANLDEKDTKVEQLVKKCQFLGKLLQNFEKKLNSPNYSSESWNNFKNSNMNIFQSQSQNNFNPNVSQNMTQNNIYESQNNFYQSMNITQPQNPILEQNPPVPVTKSEEMENVIGILKNNMSNLQIDDNKMLFESGSKEETKLNVKNEISENNPYPINDINNYPKLNIKNVTRDDRFAAYDIQLPVNYYYNMTKSQEPPKDMDWYIRPHHIETVSKSPDAISDDILNTKYISYYAPVEKPENQKSREEVLSEVISTFEANIEKLKIDLFKKANLDKNFGKVYKNLENLKEEVEKDHKNGGIEKFKIFNNRINGNGISSILTNRSSEKMSYSDMFNQNEDIQQSNMVISGYETLLNELRDKEKKIILEKRKEEYEKIRPPVDRWWELKGQDFQNELQRNKMVLKAGEAYFKKLKDLQSDKLY